MSIETRRQAEPARVTLVCTSYRCTIDAPLPISQVEVREDSARGFSIEGRVLELFGSCARCRPRQVFH